MNIPEFVASISNNTIAGAYAKSWDILDRYYHPLCSISGGSDSDIVLDIIQRLDDKHNVRYVWFNTGMELRATKLHLDFLEAKYGIRIERVLPIKSIPICVKEFGLPFISKLVSQKIACLQRHAFDFKDRTYEEDLALFPHANDGLKWWHNIGTFKQWNISYNKLLKEFLIAYPPQFHISDKCCLYVKKKPAVHFLKDNYMDLQILGIRKAEGGIRAANSSCFTHSDKRGNIFRPIFWFTQHDKREYEHLFDIKHSDCYSLYGLKRTGCVGCPFNRNLFHDLENLKHFEMGIVEAATKVFAPSYEYTKQFLTFKAHYGSQSIFSTGKEINHDKSKDN